MFATAMAYFHLHIFILFMPLSLSQLPCNGAKSSVKLRLLFSPKSPVPIWKQGKMLDIAIIIIIKDYFPVSFICMCSCMLYRKCM